MRYVPVAVLLSVSVFAQACSGRVPDAVAAFERPHARFLDCPAIFAEIKGNDQAISDLIREQGIKVMRRPAWYGKDWAGGVEGKEIQNLQSRQQYLVTLAEQTACGEPQPRPS